MQKSANDLRRRKAEKVAKKDTKKPQVPEPTTTFKDSDALSYYLMQYGGAVLGSTACAGTMYFYEQDDPWMVTKMMGWLTLALVGLLIHEFRPYQRPTAL